MGRATWIRVGTRGSRLALIQTAQVERTLREAGYRTERREVRTTGDVIEDVSLSQIGSTALFTSQLDESLLRGDIDVAVHSLKDLPTRLADGTALAAVGVREEPADAFVGLDHTWTDLPQGASVASSSLRRRAELLRARPDLAVVDIRGNVDTRLARLKDTALEGTILAAAGLIRLGLHHRISTLLSADIMLPAPGQGAIAVTARTDDDAAKRVAKRFNDRITSLCTAAERSVLRELDGGCQVPIGALAEPTSHDDPVQVRLRARVLSLDGRQILEDSIEATLDSTEAAEALGMSLAERLVALGAEDLLRTVRGDSSS